MVAILAELASNADAMLRDTFLGDAMRSVPSKYGADDALLQARHIGHWCRRSRGSR